jgi:hypothetical protein
MRRAALIVLVLALAAVLGGTARAGGVEVTVKRYAYVLEPGAEPRLRVDTYTLTCDPARGTLPYARRICADIRAHPFATLSPPPSRPSCIGPPPPVPRPSDVRKVVPWGVVVRAVAAGKVASFGSAHPIPCAWPGESGTRLYAAAIDRDPRALRASEAALRCFEDPALLAEPPPWTLIYRCMHEPVRIASGFETARVFASNPWLAPAMRRTVVDLFGGVPPISTRLIGFNTRYDRRVVVLYVFADDVDCVTCGDDPTALADDTTATVFRVSYDPATRRGLVTRLCETVRACR